jgi:hypothetical protein
MENLIISNTAWCLVVLLALALTTAATMQAWLGVGSRALKRCTGLPQRGLLAHSQDAHGLCRAGSMCGPMTSGPMRLLPRNSTFSFIRVHGAPAFGKEYTP